MLEMRSFIYLLSCVGLQEINMVMFYNHMLKLRSNFYSNCSFLESYVEAQFNYMVGQSCVDLSFYFEVNYQFFVVRVMVLLRCITSFLLSFVV